MCIRDSRKPGEERPRTLRLLARQPTVISHLLDTSVYCQPLKPVSYTHLRAHETVLDLVCRLLLENKTQQETNVHDPEYYHLARSIMTHQRYDG